MAMGVCVHNENGPNHVFIGVDESTLLRGKALAKNAQNNLTLVIKDIQDLKKYGYTVSDLPPEVCCSHIESQRNGFVNKILMLEDERIVCYDRSYISSGLLLLVSPCACCVHINMCV